MSNEVQKARNETKTIGVIIRTRPIKDENGKIVLDKDGKPKTEKVFYGRIVRVENGKKKQYTKIAKNATDARKVARDLANKFDDRGSLGFEGDKINFQKLAAIYKEKELHAAKFHGEGESRRKISGIKHHQHAHRCLDVLSNYFINRKITTLNANDINEFKAHRLSTPKENDKPRSIASVNRELEVFRSCLNFAVRQQWLKQNPFRLVKNAVNKADEVKRDRILSFEEEMRLFAACGKREITYTRGGRFGNRETTYKEDDEQANKRKHLKPLLITALDTAMRRGELFELKWSDIHFADGIIKVRQTTTKTGKSRTVPISPRMKQELSKLSEQKQNDDDLVFGVNDTIKKSWKSLIKTARIDGLRFHDLRHTGITRLIRAGVPHAEVMKISGHTQMTTFLRYLSITPETLNSAATMLANYQAQFLKPQIESVEISNAVN